MGSPDCPSLEQQAFLRKAAELPPPTNAKVVEGKLSVSLQPNALAVIELGVAQGEGFPNSRHGLDGYLNPLRLSQVASLNVDD